jgi:hypothetical protein
MSQRASARTTWIVNAVLRNASSSPPRVLDDVGADAEVGEHLETGQEDVHECDEPERLRPEQITRQDERRGEPEDLAGAVLGSHPGRPANRQSPTPCAARLADARDRSNHRSAFRGIDSPQMRRGHPEAGGVVPGRRCTILFAILTPEGRITKIMALSWSVS